MKYGKLINETLDIKNVEKGIEVGGSLTEEELIKNGYKPVCEIEKPSDANFYVYVDYETCFVQVWKKEGDEILEGEIWTSDSGNMPTYEDIERLQRDVAMVESNINSLSLSNKEALSVKEFYPKWEDFIGKTLEKGFKFQYKESLYEVIQTVPSVVEGQTPDIVPANYGLVSEHEGTKEDPIPYVRNLLIKKDKYYTQFGVLYIGIIDAPNGYAADLDMLPTLVQEVKE